MAGMTIFNVRRAVTQKVSKPDSLFSFSAEPLMLLHIPVEYITETVVFNVKGRQNSKAVIKPLGSCVVHVILCCFYIFARLKENLWNHFQDIERAYVYDLDHYLQCPKSVDSKGR